MGARRDPRMPTVLPVRVWGVDANDQPFSQTANTVNISKLGACLEGIRCLKAAGEIVGMQHKGHKSRFTVVWLGGGGVETDGRVGLRNVEGDVGFWEVPLPPTTPDLYAPPMTHEVKRTAPSGSLRVEHVRGQQERRQHTRFKCEGGAQFWKEGVEYPTWAKISDVSSGGCYVEIMTPLQQGTRLRVALTVREARIQGEATVKTSHAGMGMGISFSHLAPEEKRKLDALLTELATGSPSPAAPAATEPPHRVAAAQATGGRLQQILEGADLFQELLGWFQGHDTLSREQFLGLLKTQVHHGAIAQAAPLVKDRQ